MRNLSFYLTNLTNLLNFLFPFLIKIPSKSLPVQIETMVSLVSRTGRNLQRYEKGYRLVVGCIPYRYKKSQEPTSVEELEVLVISAQNGQGMLFPKGGWENDESMVEAAMRETEEEAGVIGVVGDKLGPWQYKSKRSCIMHESYMFPLLVQEELDSWPESKTRKRRWVSINEAREVCHNRWMRDALEELANAGHGDGVLGDLYILLLFLCLCRGSPDDHQILTVEQNGLPRIDHNWDLDTMRWEVMIHGISLEVLVAVSKRFCIFLPGSISEEPSDSPRRLERLLGLAESPKSPPPLVMRRGRVAL
ncbi:hypothetical protein NC653_034501 [Populus alba x Populus x berolinensis]|uniref:Nudix hydrolase domain-containing protein n=1 Tax=Populus alba x Populus x berolinensis TaxID=444605 RepID=A0AAD6LMN7_9ROSI|nr:hypothetical protein NC653_034501 [Populus alba x Populus x berolinensis]